MRTIDAERPLSVCMVLLYMCPHYYICVLILLYMCPHTTTICVLILILYMCPQTNTMCPHTTIMYVLILRIYVSSYYHYLSVHIQLLQFKCQLHKLLSHLNYDNSLWSCCRTVKVCTYKLLSHCSSCSSCMWSSCMWTLKQWQYEDTYSGSI